MIMCITQSARDATGLIAMMPWSLSLSIFSKWGSRDRSLESAAVDTRETALSGESPVGLSLLLNIRKIIFQVYLKIQRESGRILATFEGPYNGQRESGRTLASFEDIFVQGSLQSFNLGVFQHYDTIDNARNRTLSSLQAPSQELKPAADGRKNTYVAWMDK
jgi:hypothetical protein